MGIFRLLLAVAVVICHSGPLFQLSPLGGIEAVQAFFLISGFYMALILNEKYTGSGSYRRFIVNRLLRIYPPYWAVLAISLLVWAVAYFAFGNWESASPISGFHHIGPGVTAILWTMELSLVGDMAIVFIKLGQDGWLMYTSNFRDATPALWQYLAIPQAWSMGLEVLFYIVAPCLVRRSTAVIAGIILLSMALRAYIYFALGMAHDPWVYRFFPTEVAFFLGGALAYKVYLRMQQIQIPRWCLTASSVAFIAFCFGYQFLPVWPIDPYSKLPPHGCTLISGKQWTFYFVCWVSIPVLFLATKRSAIDRYIGELSYPVYLVHWGVLTFLPSLLHSVGLGKSVSLCVLTVSIGLAILLLHLVICPIDRLRQQRAGRGEGIGLTPVNSTHQPRRGRRAVAA